MVNIPTLRQRKSRHIHADEWKCMNGGSVNDNSMVNMLGDVLL